MHSDCQQAKRHGSIDQSRYDRDGCNQCKSRESLKKAAEEEAAREKKAAEEKAANFWQCESCGVSVLLEYLDFLSGLDSVACGSQTYICSSQIQGVYQSQDSDKCSTQRKLGCCNVSWAESPSQFICVLPQSRWYFSLLCCFCFQVQGLRADTAPCDTDFGFPASVQRGKRGGKCTSMKDARSAKIATR